MCTWRALALCALIFQSTQNAWPTSPSAPSTRDRPQARSASTPELALDPYLLAFCINKYVPARPGRSNSSKVPKLYNSRSTPDSDVRCLRTLVSTTDSDRARPLSGGFVNHPVGYGKCARVIQIDQHALGLLEQL
eukprot:5387794-Pleurochrysis_carterae.AAC.1